MTPSIVLDDLLSEIPEIVEAADDIRQLWDCTEGENDFMQEEPWLSENRVPSCLENVRRDDLEIVLLGTGSSQPSKYRNVTSIYINLFDKGGLLLDCGEGTLGQMKRRYVFLVSHIDMLQLELVLVSCSCSSSRFIFA